LLLKFELLEKLSLQHKQKNFGFFQSNAAVASYKVHRSRVLGILTLSKIQTLGVLLK
jgi:hypothetical protein